MIRRLLLSALIAFGATSAFAQGDFVVNYRGLIAGRGLSTDGFVDFYRTDSSYKVRLQGPTGLAASRTFTLPATTGTAGQALRTDGSGVTSWVTYLLPADIGSTVQGYNANLAAIAGLTYAADKCTYWTSSSAAATFTCTSYGRGLIGAADAAAARTSLGLGTLATQSGTFSGTSSGTNTGDQTTITGNAGTATALASNGTNCSAGSYPLGVDASGNVESCTTAPSSGLTVSSTSVSGGGAGQALYDTGGTLGASAMTLTSGGTVNIPAGQSYQIGGVTVVKATSAGSSVYLGGAGNTTAASNNFAFGSNALTNFTGGGGSSNFAAGASSQNANSTGSQNISIGTDSLRYATSPQSTIAIGYQALFVASGGVRSTAMGFGAGANVSTGAWQTLIGASAGGGITTGSYNTVLGSCYGFAGATESNVALCDGAGIKRFWAATVPLAESSATTVLTVPVAATAAGITGGLVQYSAIASDGTLHQVRRGQVFYSVSNAAGTETCEVHGPAGDANPDETKDGSVAAGVVSGTFTYGWTVDTSGTNACALKLNAVSSLTQTTLKIDLTVLHDAAGIITIP